MDMYMTLKTLHILSSTVLFGTGLGIAFFMFRSYFTQDLTQKLYAAQNTVLADYMFTLPAVIIQPATGLGLIHLSGYEWNEPWLLVTYGLYILAGLCWLPVVWLQIQMKNLVKAAVLKKEPLPTIYQTYFKLWFILGWPAFLGLVGVFYLMTAKPYLWG